MKSHLQRHEREQHCEKKLNIDFKEGVILTKQYTCNQCDKKFKRKENLNRHHETSHSENRKTYDCEHCGNSFSREDNLKRHVKSKHE